MNRPTVFEKEEHLMLRDSVREFLSDIKPETIKEYEKNNRFPREFVSRAGEMGLMGVFIPEEYGGAGMDYLSYVITVEELAKKWGSLSIIISAHTSLCANPIFVYGTEEQKKLWLPPLVSGKKIGCFALTEPEAGTDAFNCRSTARLEGEKYILNGRKRFITSASESGICIFLARTSDDIRRGLSVFVIDGSRGFSDVSGFTVERIEEKIGLHSSPTCELILEDVKIPAMNLLGKEGDGKAIILKSLNGGRIGIAAQALGFGERAVELAVLYAKERKQFGKPLSDMPQVREKLATAASLMESARLLIYHTAALEDGGNDCAVEAAMSKYVSPENSLKAIDICRRIFGGYGFMEDYEIARIFKDSAATPIYEGISEVQLEVVARSLFR